MGAGERAGEGGGGALTRAPAADGSGGGGAAGGPRPCGPGEFEQSYVTQWGVPAGLVGCAYHELFTLMASRGALPLALVRAPTAGGASHPYVYSCPRPTATVNRFDMIIGAAPSWFQMPDAATPTPTPAVYRAVPGKRRR